MVFAVAEAGRGNKIEDAYGREGAGSEDLPRRCAVGENLVAFKRKHRSHVLEHEDPQQFGDIVTIVHVGSFLVVESCENPSYEHLTFLDSGDLVEL